MYLILFLLFLTSCSKDYIDRTDLILAKQSKKICKEENMNVCGMGGAMMNKVTEVTVAFQAKRRVDIPEARRLMVKCIEELRDALNSNDQMIQAYLSPYPFPTSGMDISIAFINNNGVLVDYGSVSQGNGGVSAVFQLDDKLYYQSFNAQTDRLERYFIEPYEAALEIVRNSSALNIPCELDCKDSIPR